MTTEWQVAQIKRKPDTGLVFEVTYIMNFELEDQKDRHVGLVELTGDPNSPDFISFENLTEEVVLNWVESKLGQTKIDEFTQNAETRLKKRIDREKNPEFLTGLPWQD